MTLWRRGNMNTNRKYYRPEVKRITREWVRDNCKHVTERDLGLLRLIYNKRILRRDQIERLYPEFASTDRLNKRLKVLYQKYLIDKVYPDVGLGQGSSKQHVCLDKAGLILLEAEGYNSPIYFNSVGQRSLRQGWEHKVTLNEYECMIREVTNEIGAEVKMYEVEKSHPYLDTKLIPDIFCLIKYKGKGYTFFIEVDLATETVPQLKDKIDSYRDYFLSKSWTKQPFASLFKNPMFPRILLFTEENHTRRVNILEEYTDEWSLRFTYGFHSQFKQKLEDILKG
jgi:hypothetical protein